MINLTDLLNDYNFKDKSDNRQNLDIVDHQTVSFDQKNLKAKRSLSFADCNYEQMLAPKLCKSSSVEPLIPDLEYKQHLSNTKNKDNRRNKLFKCFGLMVSLGSLILVATVTVLVIMNKSEGNTRIIIIKYKRYEKINP